jgi:hypothetical protein
MLLTKIWIYCSLKTGAKGLKNPQLSRFSRLECEKFGKIIALILLDDDIWVYCKTELWTNSVISIVFLPLNQCWGSVTFWCGSGSPDPYLWLVDPDQYPTPDPTPFFGDYRHIIFSLKNLIFCSTHLWQKGRIRGRIRISEAPKHTVPEDPDPDPKHCSQPRVFCLRLSVTRFTGRYVNGHSVY